jgi:hypothetical protein
LIQWFAFLRDPLALEEPRRLLGALPQPKPTDFSRKIPLRNLGSVGLISVFPDTFLGDFDQF